MNKLIKTISAFLISTLMLTMTIPFPIYADTLEKVYCQATLGDDFIDNEILIIVMPFANDYVYTAENFREISCISVDELSYEIVEDSLCRIIKLTIRSHSKQNVLDAIHVLETRNDIYCAQPNYIYPSDTPEENVPAIASNTMYSPQSIAQQEAITLIELEEAWEAVSEINNSNNTIRIGIVDGVMDEDHESLRDYINTELGEVFTSTPIEDVEGHASKVAGVILTVLGVFNGEENNCAEGIELISLVTQSAGFSSKRSEVYIQAINYADSEGVDIDILNLSIEIEGDNAIKVALQNFNGLAVCSAGNNGRDIDEDPTYPAYYNDLDNVISVGASTWSLNVYDQIEESREPTSNYGSISVDLFAPGKSIHTTAANNSYHEINQTSAASPFVTGVAALMIRANPDLYPEEIKQILIAPRVGTDYFEDNEFICNSNGRLNAQKAISHALNNSHTRRGAAYDGVEDFSCDICGYDSSNHYFSYIPLVGDTMHKALCRRCGELFTEGHYWESLPNDMFKCRKCNKTVSGNSVPGIMIAPPPENELYGSSNENE